MNLLDAIMGSRLWALVKKEFRQTLRNKLLLYLLLVPPTVQLLILSASLDPELHNLSLAVCDQSNSAISREYVDAFSSSSVFNPVKRFSDRDETYKMVEQGKASAALIIPSDFEEKYNKENVLESQTILDGSDAYTANVASAYLKEIGAHFSPAGENKERKPAVDVDTKMLFNSGLKSSWFFVTGVLGAVLTVVGTLVSSAVLLREKEHGTLEQLLMAPPTAGEIILAKILPLVFLLVCDLVLALLLSRLFFGLPFLCNPLVFLFGAAAYIVSCIGFGMLLGTFCSSQRQAQLSSFFISIPLIQLSGSVVPFESMPPFLQNLSQLDPLRYFTLFVRESLLKGASMEVLLPNVIFLMGSAALLLSISAWRFRRQLG